MKKNTLWMIGAVAASLVFFVAYGPISDALLVRGQTATPYTGEGPPVGLPDRSNDSRRADRLQRPRAQFIDPVAGDIRRSLDYRSTLIGLRANTRMNAAQRAALAEEIRVACAIVRRPDASAERVDDDPNRQPWIDALLSRCVGLTDADLEPRDLTREELAARNVQVPAVIEAIETKESALAIAEATLRTSVDARLIVESLRYLIQNNALPLDQIFQGVPLPAEPDLDAALLPAADWLACRRSQSCGSDGLWTLYTCAQFGCPKGSDLPTALFRTLPKAQYETAQRMVGWIEG
jgi:hypothetical protein